MKVEDPTISTISSYIIHITIITTIIIINTTTATTTTTTTTTTNYYYYYYYYYYYDLYPGVQSNLSGAIVGHRVSSLTTHWNI